MADPAMRTGAIVFFLALACGAPAPPGFAPRPAAAQEATDAALGGPFVLVDQDGRNVTDEDFRGAYLLIFFGYTNCPDVCPTTLMTVAGALRRLGPAATAVRPVFVSLDPARDTPARLKEYVGSFGANFVGLTGPEDFVANLAAKYRVKYAKVPDASGGYSIDHAAALFLVGPEGEFIARLPSDLPAKDLAEALRQRLGDGAP